MFFLSPKDVSVAIDIGTQTIELVKIKRSKKINVLNAAKILLPSDLIHSSFINENISDKNVFIDTIGKLFQDANVHEKEISVNIPDASVRTFFLNLENVPRKREEAKELIQWRLKKEFTLSVDRSFVVGYHIIKKEKAEGRIYYHLLVVIINQNILQEYEESLIKAGFKPILIVPSFLGLINFFHFFSDTDKQQNIAIINMGHQITTLLVFRDFKLDFIRSFNMGGMDFTSQIKDHFSLTLELAEKKKLENIFFPEDIENTDVSKLIGTSILDNFDSIRSVQSSLCKEIADSFRHYEKQTGGHKIEKILLAGGTSMFKNIDIFFNKNFHLETSLINNLERIDLIQNFGRNEILTYAPTLGVLV